MAMSLQKWRNNDDGTAHDKHTTMEDDFGAAQCKSEIMTFCARAEIVDLQTEEHLTYIQIYYMSFRWISDNSLSKLQHLYRFQQLKQKSAPRRNW